MASEHGGRGTLMSKESSIPSTESASSAVVDQLLETEAHIPRLGPYVPLHKLGQGGMGVVYAAYDEKLDRKVALKLLRARGSEVARLRLIREARAMAKLSHPNVAQVYGIEEFGERAFIVVEFVDGVTLEVWLAERARPREEILGVFRSAGLGLAAAHAAGLVHRDFKPQNVMIRRDGRVLVMDFGLVHAEKGDVPEESAPDTPDHTSGPLTRTGALLGTPAYMPPEQFAGGETDARSDQFSFCVALWEALVGERPVIEAVTSGKFTQVERREIPVWLRDVLTRGLSVEPARRWPSMDALLGALGRDPGRRRRWIAGIAASVGAGALIGGLIVREVRQRESDLADSQAVLAQQEVELESKEHELEQHRRAIDDAANIQRAQQATLLVGERRGLEALLLAVEAAGPYGPDYMSAPTPVLQALFDVQDVTIAGQTKVIEAEPSLRHVVLSPDDAYVVAVMFEPRATVWTRDGVSVRQLEGHVPPGADATVSVCAIRLSPQHEPVELFTADMSGRVWNAAGELLFSPATGRNDLGGIWDEWSESVIPIAPVLWSRERNVAISPTGKTIVFYDGKQGVFEVWGDGRQAASKIDAGPEGRLVAGFAADGSRVFMSRGRGPILVFDEAGTLLGSSSDTPTTWAIAVAPEGSTSVTGHQPWGAELRDGSGNAIAKLEGHTGNVMYAASDPTGQMFATASEDKTIRLWDKSGELRTLLQGHYNSRVLSLTFASDATWFASANQDDTLRFWRVRPPLASVPHFEHEVGADLSLANDGSLVATRSPARFYDADGTVLVESEHPFSAIMFAPDGSGFAAIDKPGQLRFWDRAGGLIWEHKERITTDLTPLVFAPDSAHFFVTGTATPFCIWDMKGVCTAKLGSTDTVDEAIFSPDGERLMTFSKTSESTEIWDSHGIRLGTILSRRPVHMSSAGDLLFTYAPGEKPRLWTGSGQLVADLSGVDRMPKDDRTATPVGFSHDGQIVALLFNGRVYTWDQSGVLLRTFEVGREAKNMALAPDGRLIGTSGGGAQIWTIDGELVATLDGHVNWVWTIEFSPDGSQLLTGSSDAVQLWDTKRATRVGFFRRSGGGGMRFSDDGARIIESGDIPRIWLPPAAAMARACEVLSDFPDDYPRVADICERVRASAASP